MTQCLQVLDYIQTKNVLVRCIFNICYDGVNGISTTFMRGMRSAIVNSLRSV